MYLSKLSLLGSLVPIVMHLVVANNTGLSFYKPGVGSSCAAPSHIYGLEGHLCQLYSRNVMDIGQSVGSPVPMAMKLVLASSTGSPFYKPGVRVLV